jgi:hypothetical protein
MGVRHFTIKYEQFYTAISCSPGFFNPANWNKSCLQDMFKRHRANIMRTLILAQQFTFPGLKKPRDIALRVERWAT